jgi:phenylpropionate dioxygenase-like ring-hydroxylating dioxygenase large terminal subunit
MSVVHAKAAVFDRVGRADALELGAERASYSIRRSRPGRSSSCRTGRPTEDSSMTMTKSDEEIYDRLRREGERTSFPEDLPPIPPLPARRYSDPEFYALELEHVFKKRWLAAGHISELPKPGSYRLWEEFGQSIIISRGIDNVVRAFKNACRHRAAAIVTEKSGTVRRFVCPYHAWGYSTDGALKSVPEPQNFACLNKAELPLHQIRCEIWRGFIHINFDEQAKPLADYIAPLATLIEDFPFEQMTVKGVLTTELECNWKVAYDNFLESYHINTVHRKTIAPFIDTKTWTAELLPDGHSCMRTFKRGSDTLFRSEKISAESYEAGAVARRYRDISIAVPRFPNSTAGLDPAGFNWQSFWPTGPNSCRIYNLYLGVQHGTEEEDRKYWADFIAYNETILAEDMFLFPSMQRSIREGDISHVNLATQEQVIQWYHEHLDRAVGVERVPADLRVKPVLTEALGL